jgi:hypothetical protein
MNFSFLCKESHLFTFLFSLPKFKEKEEISEIKYMGILVK